MFLLRSGPMVLAGWLMSFRARLLSGRFRLRPRLRKRHSSFGIAAAEILELRQLLAAAVTAVSPNQGTTQGGTPVQITGSGFTRIGSVKFGALNATSFTVNAAQTVISAVSPAEAAGRVDIVVYPAMG